MRQSLRQGWLLGPLVSGFNIQSKCRGGKIVSSYKRHWNVFGGILNLIGISLVILGVIRVSGFDIRKIELEWPTEMRYWQR
jgi:hypothetical protein